MNIGKALAALTSSEKKETGELIEHSFITSSRFLVLIGMVGLILWLTLKGLADLKVVIPVTAVALAYIFSNTVTRIYQIKANSEIIRDRQRLAWADGVLTPEEALTLRDAETKSASVDAVIGK